MVPFIRRYSKIYIVFIINFVANRYITDNISLLIRFYNDTLDYKRHFSVACGAYCKITNPTCDNCISERHQDAIISIPGVTSYGGSEVILLNNNKFVARRTVKDLSLPDIVIQYRIETYFTRRSHNTSIGQNEDDKREGYEDTPEATYDSPTLALRQP